MINRLISGRALGALVLIVFLGVIAFGSAWAQSGRYQEGIHYFEVEQFTLLPEGSKQLLVEAFSYLCSHCNTFEPYIANWQKRMPADVQFRRVPVIFGRATWELYARAYVTAEMMGVAHAAHGGLMDAIWKRRNMMKTTEELANFYEEYGVEAAKFLSTSKSFAVDAKMRKDQRALQGYGVKGTPTLIVNGKYRVAGSEDVPSYDVMLAVVDYLIEMEAAVRASAEVPAETAAGDTSAPSGE